MPSKPANEPGDKKTPGTLFLVGTPIGNLSDLSLRALDTLRQVDGIAAEDTRRTRKLLSHYDIRKPLISCHAHNEVQRSAELLQRLIEGEKLALVTDAGTPGISDPGAYLVGRAIEAGIPVSVIPGPAALIAALAASGLSTHPFAFLGFAPARGPNRRKFFASHASLPMTLVLYESPKRLCRTLEDILDWWGDRKVCVARELTKIHEEFFRGRIREAVERYRVEPKGEITLVVSGFEGKEGPAREETQWRARLREILLESGMGVGEASAIIAREYGLPKRVVYREALKQRES
ncbi:MAG TPA: 16S rRNA (cytidine(1402)-2'-O)-methyltransferase [Syntrophobacteraceae bacterium]|nr:16S rRNA (cytidine(1402)-2'-O)-methyltransferase [Syntrophobacteraceae bacterium]